MEIMKNSNYQFEIKNDGKRVRMIIENGWSERPVSRFGSIEKTKQAMIQEQLDKIEHKKWREEIANLTKEQQINHHDFRYSRSRNYGVTFYFHSKWSPTGVEAIGGCDHDESRELFKFKNTPLSPTENLQTAR